MKQDLTSVTIILDRSGSMATIREATVKMFNDFITQQKVLPGECHVQFVQFDTPGSGQPDVETVFSLPLPNVPELQLGDFMPRGSTPLHDAMGMTIADMKEQLKATPEDEKPSKVLVITITDGAENASREYTADKIRETIEELEKEGWDFVFLGANQDAVLAAQRYGIAGNKAMTYATNDNAVNFVASSLNSYTSSVRCSVGGQSLRSVSFSDEDRANVMSSTSEDDKGAHKPPKKKVN